MNCRSEWVLLYTNYFNFQVSYLHAFYKPNNIKSKPSTKVIFKLIFKFSTLKGQISAPLWTQIGHKGWRKEGKTFRSFIRFSPLSRKKSSNPPSDSIFGRSYPPTPPLIRGGEGPTMKTPRFRSNFLVLIMYFI